MIRRRSVASRERTFIAGLVLALLASLIPLAAASAADAVIGPATGGEAISSDQFGTSSWTTLTGPTFTEGAAGDLGSGTFTLNLPAGFKFNSAVGTAAEGGAGCAGLSTSAISYGGGDTTATVTLTGPSTMPCVLSFTGLQVQPSAGTPLASGAITGSGTANEPAGSYGTLTQVPGAAILTFGTQPSAGNTAGVAFATQPIVHSEDQFGTDRVGDMITLTITPGTGNPDGTLTCTANAVATIAGGDAAFAGCRIDRAGTGYRLRATGASDTEDSALLDIAIGPADHLGFVASPNPMTPALLTPQPVVGVFDAGGNLVNDNGRPITLGITANSGTFSCAGGLMRVTSLGTATYSGCQQTTVANFYSLTADDGAGGLAMIVGPPFSVTSGAASQLRLCWGPALPCNTTPPATIVGGGEFLVQPVVRVTDAAGNTVTSDNTTVVTLAITPNTPTSGGPGTLTCTNGLNRTVVAGVATYAGCAINRAGTGYRLRATSNPVYTLIDSNAFNVAVGLGVKLGFVTQPTTGSAGVPFTTNLSVAIQDLGGNTVPTGISATISLAINPNSTGAILTCANGTVVPTSNGIATFTDCRIDRAGSFTVVATATNVSPPGTLTAAASTPIVVGAPPAMITLSASSVITWGETVVFTIQFGPNGANRSFTMQASPNNVTWTTIITPPLMTNGSGQGSFAYRPARNLYYRAVFAGANDLGAGMSNVQRVVVRQIALLRPTNNGAVDHVAVGTTIRFTVTVRPARSELPPATVTFVVYRLIGRTWTLAASRDVVINAAGLAAVDVTFPQAGKWYVRSIARPTSANANSVWSPVERYDVP